RLRASCPNRIPVISKLALVLDIYSSLSLIWRYSYCPVFQGATSKKICEEGFIHAWGLAGKSFPASCDTTENAVKLHESWQQGLDESMRSSRLN
ncbi:hypothetical protein ACLH04_22640, partial [Enterobacter hormaechei]